MEIGEACSKRPGGRELRRVVCRVRGRGSDDARIRSRKREGKIEAKPKAGIAHLIGRHVARAYEGLPLEIASGSGEELKRELSIGRAVESSINGRGANKHVAGE